jgi:hypothetical protein
MANLLMSPEELAVWTIWSMKMEAVSFSETSATIHDEMGSYHRRHKSVSIVYIMHCSMKRGGF